MRAFLVKYGLCSGFVLALISTSAAQDPHPMMTYGFYQGVGGSWNTINEAFSSTLATNQNRSGNDHYQASDSRLAPMLQLGYWRPYYQECMWGLHAQWFYLNYATPNVGNSRGQIMQNATFSSRNSFGGQTDRDFTALTRLRNEFNLIAYVGKYMMGGYYYAGIGPALLTVENSIYVSSVHIPNGVGDHLISTSVGKHRNIWGGIASIGYRYYLQPKFFIDINYSYLLTGKNKFNNTVNAAVLNGSDTPGPTTLHVQRSIQFAVQNVVVSFNKMLCW